MKFQMLLHAGVIAPALHPELAQGIRRIYASMFGGTEDQLAIDKNVEDSASALHQLGVDTDLLLDRGRQTGGLREVVSGRAIRDRNLHHSASTAKGAGKGNGPHLKRSSSALHKPGHAKEAVSIGHDWSEEGTAGNRG